MELIGILMGFLLALTANALPAKKNTDSSALVSKNPALEVRQFLTADYLLACCQDCDGYYSYHTYWETFNDLCYWLSQGQTLWTHDSYYTDDYYCNPSWHPGVCVRLQIQYWCGSMWEGPVSDANPAGAVRVDYAGCMGYFQDAVQPRNSCGGPPYNGGRIITASRCWTFSVVGQDGSNVESAVVVPDTKVHAACPDCEPGARMRKIATDENGTVLEGAFATAEFGHNVEVENEAA